MNEEINEIGYHATSLKSAELILKGNYNKSISTPSKKHWLGDGVYFFNDICWAVQWNVNELKKKKNKNKKISDFTVLKSKIIVYEDYLLDFSSVFGKEILEYLKEQLIEKLKKEKKEYLLEDIKKRSLKFFINLLEDYNLLEEFYVIKATYVEKRETEKIRHSDDFLMRIQCQICVKNTNCIKETQEYENKKKLYEIYDALKK